MSLRTCVLRDGLRQQGTRFAQGLYVGVEAVSADRRAPTP